MNRLQSAARADLARLSSPPTPLSELQRRAQRWSRRRLLRRLSVLAVVVALAISVPLATLGSTTRLKVTSQPTAPSGASSSALPTEPTATPPSPPTTAVPLPALGAPGFPNSIYPAPLPSATVALGACPNPAGLEPFDQQTQAAALRLLRTLAPNSLIAVLQQTDRSWWPNVATRSPQVPTGTTATELISAEPASQSPYSILVKSACGAQLLQDSLAVVVGPPGSNSPGPAYCDACRATVFFLNRSGHPLVYFLY
jgi:hypothetical protein